MTSTTRSLTIRSTGRRIVGALSAGAAVAVVGIGALPAGTATTAGIHLGPVHRAEASAADPAGVPAAAVLVGVQALGTVVHRHDGTRFVRV